MPARSVGFVVLAVTSLACSYSETVPMSEVGEIPGKIRVTRSDSTVCVLSHVQVLPDRVTGSLYGEWVDVPLDSVIQLDRLKSSDARVTCGAIFGVFAAFMAFAFILVPTVTPPPLNPEVGAPRP